MTGTRSPEGHGAAPPSGMAQDDRTELHRLCVFELDLTCGHCLTVSLNGWYPVSVACCDRLGGTWHKGVFYPFASNVDFVRCLEERYEHRPLGAKREPLRVLRRRQRTDDPTVPAHSWQRGTAGRFPERVGGPGPRSWAGHDQDEGQPGRHTCRMGHATDGRHGR
ncbi:hypothetical protein EDC02_7689 [Micromonospora sp. Llam0]|uniref:hypothetical protein n=1 Tax=Micromonospora sp. Llam0 TaxID=2485143 RepID=UPI000F473941|nr:hypothetical protein [Micromonospora sp. Llam0]ROO52748.1 hypothetical protein EDC02_7689 [Micromonospora sp. Llam0]